MADGSVLIVGGTAGLGREIANHYQAEDTPVIITGRDQERTEKIASDLGEGVRGIAVDLTEPGTIGDAFSDVGPVSRLVITAVVRDHNPIREYNLSTANDLIIMKMIGYTESIHTLVPLFTEDASVVLFGGLAKERPYPGAVTIATVNGGISTMINDLVVELAPTRFNAIHPGIVGDSPFWEGKDLDAYVARTPTGKLATMANVVDATVFLLENPAVNGVNLYIDGGWMRM